MFFFLFSLHVPTASANFAFIARVFLELETFSEVSECVRS